ncbi:MAG: ATP-grasp domain-containing protein [Candidatus Korobacteraceae bacterium]|jgi:hypothetical protein
MKPKVLLAATTNWFSTARLATSLAKMGFTVEAVCPSGNPIAKTKVAPRSYDYRGLAGPASFQRALSAAQPDLVIPCDNLATSHLYGLYDNPLCSGQEALAIRELLERSLGDHSSYPILAARSKFIAVAREEGIAAPEMVAITTASELATWSAGHGFPAVLKTNGSSGGGGVQFVSSAAEATQVFGLLSAPPLASRAISRVIFDRDFTLVLPCLRRKRPVVNVQGFIAGRDATIQVACWQGKVVASITAEVLQVWEPKGPSTVLRLIDNREMAEAAEKIARRLGLSGLHGFDFILEEGTGKAYVIEANPRATQVCHLQLGAGHDLPASLYTLVTGEPLGNVTSVTDREVIALFPQAWVQNPSSEYLQSGYHDVPWDEPELVRACMKLRQNRWHSYANWARFWSKLGLNRP